MKDIGNEYQAVLGPLSEALAAAGWDLTKLPNYGEEEREEDEEGNHDQNQERMLGKMEGGLNELNQNYENIYLIQARNAFQEEK